MRILVRFLFPALLLGFGTARAQAIPGPATHPSELLAAQTPAQTTPGAEPPVKAVPQTERKSKPERVADDNDDAPEAASARGSRPERSARGARGSRGAGGVGRGARGANGGGAGRPTGVGRGH